MAGRPHDPGGSPRVDQGFDTWFGVLGAVQMRHAGQAVTLGGIAPRLVFSQLLLANGRPVTDERLAAIWNDASTDPTNALRVTINRLRKRLTGTAALLERDSGGYVLVGPFASDLGRLGAIESELDRTAHPADVERLCLQAISLWRGPALADLRTVSIANRLAVPLDERLDRIRRRLVGAATSIGSLPSHVPAFAAWVDDDPTDEHAALALARSLWLSGQSAAALRALSALRAALVEIGLEVSASARQLERQILDDTVAAPLDRPMMIVPPLPIELRKYARRQLAGRERDLEHVLSRLRSAEPAAMVRLAGPAGVGKTALVAHVAEHLARSGVAVAYAAGSPLGNAPYEAWSSWVSWLGGVAEPVTWNDDDVDPNAAKARLSARVRASLDAVCRDRAVVLIADDVQWLDDTSLAAVRQVLDEPLDVRFVCLERDDHPTVLEHGRVLTYQVAPLDVAAVQSMLEQHPELPAAKVHDATGGLPLLVEELVRRGLTAIDGRKGDLFEDAEGLPGDALDTLTCAALLGSRCRFSELVALRDRRELDVLEHVDLLIRAGKLIDDVSGVVEFAHELYRVAALARWSQLRLSRMHAEALERVVDVEIDPTRALHHAIAGRAFIDSDRLASICQHAARRFVGACSWEDALDAIEPAWQVFDDPRLGDEQRIELATLGARSASALGRVEDLDRFVQRSMAIGRDATDVSVRAKALAVVQYRGHRNAPDPALVDAILTLVPDVDGSTLPFVERAKFARLAAWTAVYGGSAAAFDTIDRMLASLTGEPMSTTADRAAMLTSRHMLASVAGERQRAAGIASELEALAADDPALPTQASLILHHFSIGDRGMALAVAEQLHARATANSDPHSMWIAELARFTEAFVGADLDRARQLADAAHRFGQRRGLFGVFGAYASQLFGIGWVNGDLSAFVNNLRHVSVASLDLPWRGGYALACAVSGEAELAEAALMSACDAVGGGSQHWLGMVGIVVGVEAAWLTGNQAFLEVSLPTLEGRAATRVLLGQGAMDYGPVARYLGLARAGLGDVGSGRELLRAVRDDPCSGPLWQRRAAVDLAALAGGQTPVDGPWSWVPSRCER